jgi:hypothetical protein
MKNHKMFNIDYDVHYHPAKSQIEIQRCMKKKNMR